MQSDLPSHIKELIRDLTENKNTHSVLTDYSRFLHCDSFLHSVYLELGYKPELGQFPQIPSIKKITESLCKEYSYISLPLKRTSSDSSESSCDKARNNKGLKILSSRVKAILIHKKLTSYREVAEELIKEMNTVNKIEEKNILRRVYDSLNVLIAAGVVFKQDKVYC